ncbi:hypothetical protein D9615_007827 [Tricholomella constricta]|uniref:Telomerase Cajal body protein 1 n=1 Tax=Tricholomella constricta TaxID=117010 RepID=A0A8H5H4T0_9AGAR|nr:hypothetical protein D9615_007827 [Tricholomella constricta]
MEIDSEYAWLPPQYDVSQPPSFEASMQLASNEDFAENFVRTAKWCPDGSALLAQCENRTFQLFTRPASSSTSAKPSQAPDRVFAQPSPILDFIWYPTASPIDPASFCFVASVRECPVKLLDASDGRLRASYRIVDHRERQIAPHSLAFNISAERLYCGFEDAVEVFDVNRPGEGTRLPTTPSKKSKDGLKGIISALAFVPSQGSDMYAAGSLSPTLSNIAMFSEAHGAEPVMFVSGGPPAGVTQINFNPARPHMMYAAYRRHGAIYSWDIRSNVDAPVKVDVGSAPGIRWVLFMSKLTNGFGSPLYQNGKVSFFDLQGPDTPVEPSEEISSSEAEESYAALEFDAHGDAIGSVAFHPHRSLLLSASGSRHFHPTDASESSDSEESVDSEADSHDAGTVPTCEMRGIRRRGRPHPVTLDASIKTWAFDSQTALPLQLPQVEIQT